MSVTFHFVTSGKGASGKSVFATALIDILRNSGKSVAIVDADPQQQSVSSLYPESTEIVLGYDPDLEDMPMEFYNMSQEETEPGSGQLKWTDIVIDLASDTDLHINRWIDSVQLEEIAEIEQITIIKWWVCDGSEVSLNAFAKSADTYKKIKHVLVKNYARCRENKWDRALAPTEVDRTSLISIPLRKVYGKVADELRANGRTWNSVLDAYNDRNWATISVATGSIVNGWLRDTQESIASVYSLDLPTLKTPTTKEEEPNNEIKDTINETQTANSK